MNQRAAALLWNCSYADAKLSINGENIPQSKDFRFGHINTLEGADLVAWVNVPSEKPLNISLVPVHGFV